MIVPLVVIQTGSSLSASAHDRATGRSHAGTRGTSVAAGRTRYFPAWQLAADSIKSTAATGATNLAVPPIPTTTVATSAPTTATTSAPTTIYVTPTTQAARVQTTTPATNPAPVQAPAPAPAAAAPPPAHSITGVVTYYDATPGTCASPTLPFGTVVTITNPDNGATVRCTVDDREADTARQIDLATATFAQIAPLSQGVISNAQLSW